MRTTFILELDPSLVEFIHSQQEFSDPSVFINQLLRKERNQQGLGTKVTDLSAQYYDDIHVELEEFLDQDIQAAD